ncbi:hypothetical protein DAPPUDRAFT_100812 [Daphnia pulex]|uniref:Uncharacterized protein n=1 Tax=Daphnia pulex TaxID=6669 RepID=E9GBC8_DAPPU|nr:hypothetical protein DAPPUDRAFT_100812 [Daphnia pulex]|eukprot:EFX82938.1 hypothetical protein DAPPUDRAFT_100812 [Daphnia pulex]
MASSELRRPKSANPNRRLRTATHKVTDPRVRPEQPAAERGEESSEYHNLNESLSVWTNDSLLEEVDPGQQQQRPSAASGSKQQRTPSPTSSTYDSLMTFECIQKASALRVLAKTLDRQRDVLQQASSSSGGNGSSTATGDSADSRKTTPPPRKLRPLGREYSGPF